jgi:hypothetical protein
MQRVFGGPKETNANRLNCTANDVSIARALTAVNLDTGLQSCIEGTHFTLQATFQVDVTAAGRYDEAFFFNIGGGASARDVAGTCSESILTNPAFAGDNIPVLNLDRDTCGDLAQGSYTTITFTIPDVLCAGSELVPTKLRLPNCTSWHSNAQSVCTTHQNADGAYDTAGPETKSKCNCDDNFTIPINIESPSGAVVKTATQAQVTYQVEVKNNSTTRTVVIDSLTDDVYGDITAAHSASGSFRAVDSSTCNTLINTEVGPSTTSTQCTFKATYLDPGTDGDLTNTVTAGVHDKAAPNTTVNLQGSTTINVDLNK